MRFHARSSPQVGQQPLEEMLLEYVSPPGGCRSIERLDDESPRVRGGEGDKNENVLLTCSEK